MKMAADHRRHGGGDRAVPARHGERRHRGLRARSIRCSSALNAALAALLAGAGRLSARRPRAALSRARVRHAPDAAAAGCASPRSRCVPGLIVYAVSVQFLTRSIESWFDVKVDAALEGGINLGQQAIDQMMLELQGKARAMALELADAPQPQLPAQPGAPARSGGRGGGGGGDRERTRGRERERGRDSPGARAAGAATCCARRAPSAAIPRSMSVAGRPLSLRVLVPLERARAGGRGALPAAAQHRAAAVRAAAPRRSRPPTATTASSRSRATG